MTSYPVAKLILDKTLSGALLIVLSPVFAFLFVAMGIDMLVRSEDRGPWLYRERRISRGREFDLLKFRTLRRDVLERAPGEAHARLHEADEANLTWAGRRLLKPWYLDELPQIWNVLRGDMSVVGPRPWPPSMVANQVAQGFSYRNEFVAGWTGPAQVREGSHRVGRLRGPRRCVHRHVPDVGRVAARSPRPPHPSGDYRGDGEGRRPRVLSVIAMPILGRSVRGPCFPLLACSLADQVIGAYSTQR